MVIIWMSYMKREPKKWYPFHVNHLSINLLCKNISKIRTNYVSILSITS